LTTDEVTSGAESGVRLTVSSGRRVVTVDTSAALVAIPRAHGVASVNVTRTQVANTNDFLTLATNEVALSSKTSVSGTISASGRGVTLVASTTLVALPVTVLESRAFHALIGRAYFLLTGRAINLASVSDGSVGLTVIVLTGRGRRATSVTVTLWGSNPATGGEIVSSAFKRVVDGLKVLGTGQVTGVANGSHVRVAGSRLTVGNTIPVGLKHTRTARSANFELP